MICLKSRLWIKNSEIIRAPNPEMSLSEHPGTGHALVPGVNFGFSYILSFKTKLKQLFELSGQLVSQPNNFPQRADINFPTTFFTETFYITLIISQLEDP